MTTFARALRVLLGVVVIAGLVPGLASAQGRDPFVPSADPSKTVAIEPAPIFSAEVTAVLLTGTRRLATLRMSPTELTVVEEGQRIGRWSVVSITSTEVRCTTLYLGKPLPVTLTVRKGKGAATPATSTTTTTALPTAVGADIPLLPPPSSASPARRPDPSLQEFR